MKKIKAVVFDMDGLMFDTERLWLYGVKRTNEVYKTNVPLKLIKDCIGSRKDVIDLKLKEYMGQEFDTAEFRRLNKEFMQERVEKFGLKKKKGLITLLRFLEKINIPMAIASSSLSNKVERRFKESKLSKHYFKVIVSGDMVENSKPNPEIYLKACEMLGFKPSEVIALEDSENGLLSAINAGCKTVCVPDVKMPSEDVLKRTYRQFKSLDEVISLF